MRVLVEMNKGDFESIARAGFSVRMVRHVAHGLPPASSVLEAACEVFRLTVDELKQDPQSHKMRYIRAKELFIGVAREMLDHSYPELAKQIGPTFVHSNAVKHDQNWKARTEHDDWIPGMTKAQARKLVRARLGMEIPQ